MDARVKKVGEIAQDNLIAGIYPPADVTDRKSTRLNSSH